MCKSVADGGKRCAGYMASYASSVYARDARRRIEKLLGVELEMATEILGSALVEVQKTRQGVHPERLLPAAVGRIENFSELRTSIYDKFPAGDGFDNYLLYVTNGPFDSLGSLALSVFGLHTTDEAFKYAAADGYGGVVLMFEGESDERFGADFFRVDLEHHSEGFSDPESDPGSDRWVLSSSWGENFGDDSDKSWADRSEGFYDSSEKAVTDFLQSVEGWKSGEFNVFS
jgi:hypothetical protein